MSSQKEEKRADAIMEFREGNISLILDSYDDIFSDFDPRPYSEKALSDDFLIECKKAARDKEDRLELRFLIPKNKRDYKDEIKIKKRLREHFQRHHREVEREINKVRWNGVMWFMIGAIILVISTLLLEYQAPVQEPYKFLFTLLIIISQPAGWFTLWEGLTRIFITPDKNITDYDFYKKMSKSEIVFLDY